MMTADVTPAPRGKWRKFALQALLGALLGAGFSVGVNEMVDSGVLGTFSAAQEAAAFVAMLYGVIGLLVGFGTALPRAGATMLNVEDEEELREQRRMLAWSAGSMVLMGALLALLALAGPGGMVPPGPALAFYAAGWLVLAGASVVVLRNMDELMRALTRETGELAYYLVLTVCGGWAVLAWLGYVPAMGMLPFITMNHGLLLLASFIAAARRGMIMPR